MWSVTLSIGKQRSVYNLGKISICNYTFHFFSAQNEKLEEKIIEYHKSLIGYNPAEAERRFLNLARSQDLYGVDPHPCKVSYQY